MKSVRVVGDADQIDMSSIYYLAGPMSGYPKYNFDAFESACMYLRDVKIIIASPHEIDHGETEENRGSLPYEAYMKAGMDLLEKCEGIILLAGWAQSTGARRELQRALELDYPAFFFDQSEGAIPSLVCMNRRPPE